MIKQMELERVTENSKASRETDDWKLVKRILGEMPYKYAD